MRRGFEIAWFYPDGAVGLDAGGFTVVDYTVDTQRCCWVREDWSEELTEVVVTFGSATNGHSQTSLVFGSSAAADLLHLDRPELAFVPACGCWGIGLPLLPTPYSFWARM